jgi:arylsulfatase A-like enzyme
VALIGCSRGPDLPPNLLLITVDTLRADRLPCYGGDAGVGESICALAEGGTLFRWAITPAPYTAPAIASLLSSTYPGEHGVTQSVVSFLSSEATTVAEVLEAAGYQTAAFVSNPVLDKKRSLGQGFQVYDQHMTRRERNRPGYRERDAENTTDATLAWAQVAAREPWFVWVHYQDPHGPYEPPDAAATLDDPGDSPLPVLTNHSGFGGIPAYQALPGLHTAAGYENRYADEIRYLDPHVRRLVEELDALGRPPAVLVAGAGPRGAHRRERAGQPGGRGAHPASDRRAGSSSRLPGARPARRRAGRARTSDGPRHLRRARPTGGGDLGPDLLRP